MKSIKWMPLIESVHETIARIGLIQEMALPMKKYKQYIIGMRKQIAENWCLCKYCQMFDPSNYNFNHWRGELYAALDGVNDIHLKRGMSKKSALTEVMIDAYEYDTKDGVKKAIERKFKIEKLDSDSIMDAVSGEFASKIGVLIDGLSNEFDVVEYINNEFGIDK